MSFSVSVIPYANMAPFRALGPPRGGTFVNHTPQQSTQALLRAEVMAAPMPVGDLPKAQNQVELLGAYGIAAAGAVGSVLVFSECPLDDLKRPSKVFLTDQSSSSVRLLFLLLGHRLGFDRLPYRTRYKNQAQGQLLIGDEALVSAAQGHGRVVTDLAEEWFRDQQLPMVFARWVIRKDAPRTCRASLEAWLATFQEREQECLLASVEPEARRLGVSASEMRGYLQGIKRVLGEAELEGQRLFLEELIRHERTPLFLPDPGDQS